MEKEPKKNWLWIAIKGWSIGNAYLTVALAILSGGAITIYCLYYYLFGDLLILAFFALRALGFGTIHALSYILRCFRNVNAGVFGFAWTFIKIPFYVLSWLFGLSLHFFSPFATFVPWRWGKFIETWHLNHWLRSSIQSIERSHLTIAQKESAKRIQTEEYGKKMQRIWQ